MSVRALWIISRHNAADGKLLFNRTFPTVEQRAKESDGELYVPLPEPKDVAKLIIEALGLKYQAQEFVASRDSCSLKNEKPVFEVPTPFGQLWPLLVVEQYGMVYCCLSSYEKSTPERPALIDIPGISAGFSLLLGMSEFTGPLSKDIDEYDDKMCELHMYVGEAAPFGSPVLVDANLAQAALLSHSGTVKTGENKQPAWRPTIVKGSNHINFLIKENVRAMLYDKPNVPDAIQIYGHVTCHSDLDGLLPEVDVTLSTSNEQNITLESILVDPCVQRTEKKELSTGVCEAQISFLSPAYKFHLCQYTMKVSNTVPIEGFYQVKGEKDVDVLVQLKLSAHLKNSLEYCELQMPFFNRGSISSVDSHPSQGAVLIAPNKRTLVWNVGLKFPTKTLEVSLKASLKFPYYKPESKESNLDPFCIGNNTYAQLYFKIKDSSLSGLHVENKSVQVHPNARFKVSSSCQLSGLDYKIWNCHGDAPHALSPPEGLLNSLIKTSTE